VWQFGIVLQRIHCVTPHRELGALAAACCDDDPATRPRFDAVHRRLVAAAASVTSDPPVTGEVVYLDMSSPATSNETGYSLLTVLQPKDSILQTNDDDDYDDDDGQITHQLQQPDNEQRSTYYDDATGHTTRTTRSRSLSPTVV